MSAIIAPPQNKTGYQLGSLSPTIWWEKTNGIVYVHGCAIEKHILIPPTEIGDGGRLARQLYEDRRVPGRPNYKDQGYAWRETHTMRDVQELQRRWIEQEMKVRRHMGQHDHTVRQKVHKEVASRLRQRMASGSTTAFERDFIKYWLDMRENKQDEYTKKWEDYHYYSQPLEFDSSHKLEDRIGGGV
jgi:hypothetical protein